MVHRIAPPLIRHVLDGVRTGEVSAQAAAEALGLSRNRLYQLFSDYLAAYGPGTHRSWAPGVSGGDHAPAWPPAVTALLRKRLNLTPKGKAFWFHFFGYDKGNLNKLERTWINQYRTAHGRLPILNKADSPVS